MAKAKLLYEPSDKNRKQLEAHRFSLESAEPLILSGGVGSGKSIYICNEGVKHAYLFPGNEVIIGRLHHVDLRETTLVSFFKNLGVTEDNATDHPLVIRYRKSPHEIIIRTADPKRPSRIRFMGFQSSTISTKTSATGSLEANVILLDEIIEFSEEMFDWLTTRLRWSKDAPHRIGGATNSSTYHHWIWKQYEQQQVKVIFSSVYDNKENLPVDYIPRLEKKYAKRNDSGNVIYDSTGNALLSAQGKRILNGEWGIQEGLVYDEFSKNNIVEDVREVVTDTEFFLRHWHHYCGVDFGYHPDPFCCLWISTNTYTEDSAVWVVWKEHYKGSVLMRKHAETLQAGCKGIKVKAWLCDHEAQLRAELQAELNGRLTNKVHLSPAKKSIEAGIQTVKNVIRDGRLKIVAPECPNLIREMSMYKWDDREFVSKSGNTVPFDKYNHACDPLRYVIHTVTRGTHIETRGY